MLTLPNKHKNQVTIGFTGSFYFNTGKVDELGEELKTKTKICYEIETFEWEIREFAMYDNNEYRVQFGEPRDNIGNTE
ncbi:hypothetical protein [Chryseobacterium sp. SIMBA_028]|uniref:hypothetical protein n=1 Tax=Chryseobacterium sp. SIMBA_028 TaxID=3085771 RepID=UPI00397DDA29